jgi:tetratricopeptide (TPR) repeat protein
MNNGKLVQEQVKRQDSHNVISRYAWWQYLLPPALISLLTVVFYYPSLRSPFQFDDLANITKKFDIRFFDPFKQILCNSRWVGEWLNKLNYQIGQFDPWYYRVCNLTIHIITGVLVFAVVYGLCRKATQNKLLHERSGWIASTTMALFLLHPVQTQTVSYVIQARLEGLASLFVLACIGLFLAAYSVESKGVRGILLTLTTLLGFISCGTKEIVIVAPFLMLAVDWFFVAQGSWDSFKKRLWFHVIFTTVILFSLLYYLKPQFFFDVLGFKITTPNNRGNILTDNAMDSIRPLHYLISEFKVILHYLWIFLWPLGISVEYDWKLASSFFSPDAFLPLVVLLSIAAYVIYLIRENKLPHVAFGLIWFFVAIAPRSTIIPSPELVCDYKTYLASVGWLFLLSVGIVFLIDKVTTLYLANSLSKVPRYAFELAAVAILAFPLGGGTMQRNLVWSTSIAFWQDVVIKAPLKARAHNNLGVAFSEEGRFDEAIPYYLQAIKLDRVYSDPWSNLAVAYSVKSEDDKAIAALQEALRIFPNYPEAYNNLGTLFIKKKEYDQAEKLLRQAIALRAHYGKAWFNLGRLYLEQNKQEEAWTFFSNATKGDLDTAEGYHILGQISMQLKKYTEAAAAFENAARLGANTPQVAFNMANAHFMSANYQRAGELYAQLMQIAPGDPRFAYNLAESKYALKQFEEAAYLFKQISAAGPEFAHAHVRASHAYEGMKQFGQAKEYLASIKMTSTAEDFQRMIADEMQRISIQERLVTGSGSVTLTGEQFKNLLASRTSTQIANAA